MSTEPDLRPPPQSDKAGFLDSLAFWNRLGSSAGRQATIDVREDRRDRIAAVALRQQGVV